jgi:hypothetical protein
MGSGDLSAALARNLALGILTPASSVRAAEENAANPETQEKARRRPRQEQESENESEKESLDDLGPSLEAGGQPAHQLDRLA